MKELIKKEWEYTLYEKDNQLILSVICGSIALYEVDVTLTKLEEDLYKIKGKEFIEELVEKIRYNPKTFTS